MRDLYDDAEIAALLAEHPSWTRDTDGALARRLTFKDFAHALLFVNAVGHLAEAADHHPDIRIHGYRHVELLVTSHDVGGITDRDRRLVEAIQSLPGLTG